MQHCHNTVHGLNEWTQAMFEKFGWMILASENNRKKSILGYIDSLQYLHKCLLLKAKNVESIDTENDLKELATNVSILIHHSKKLL
jgi:hypothetical protein